MSGEYVRIKDSLNQIVEDMRKTVSTIQEVAREIDSGSAQLAYAADDWRRLVQGRRQRFLI